VCIPSRLCLSNPELIEQIARNKIAELSGDPSRSSVSLAPNDGGRLTFCMCERCKALDPPEGRKISLLYDDASGERIKRHYFDYVSLTDRMVTAAHRVLDRKYWMMRDIFSKDQLAVNTAYIAWGGGGYWKRFSWRWQADHAKPDVAP